MTEETKKTAQTEETPVEETKAAQQAAPEAEAEPAAAPEEDGDKADAKKKDGWFNKKAREMDAVKAKLDAEGLFAPEHKKPLPQYPRCIGLVTSKTGAALQDIRNVISRRWPAVRLLLCPVSVQGFEAAQDVAAAIDRLDKSGKVDEIIVARGGGSREDLWVFNAEIIARAAYRCKTPLISAIGHEIDFTILDLVADQRAPTPSAAAELAVPDRAELARKLCNLEENIQNNIQSRLNVCYNELMQMDEAFSGQVTRRTAVNGEARLNAYRQQLQAAATAAQRTRQQRLRHAAALAASLNPYQVLARGYTLLYDEKGRVSTADALREGEHITLRGTGHTAQCTVTSVEEINESTQKL